MIDHQLAVEQVLAELPTLRGVRLGVTGSSAGATIWQSSVLAGVLRETAGELHHGDCVGVDQISHELARAAGNWFVVGHPPNNAFKRAFCGCDRLEPQREYLTRNRAIAAVVDVLLAAPREVVEVVRSGTWTTVRYAEQEGTPCAVLLPTGEVVWR